MMREARTYLEFSCKCYAKQNSSGRIFVHEHPAHADSWSEKCIKDLLRLEGIHRAELDMCQFNLQTTDKDGTMGLVKKSTSLLTNSSTMARMLSRKCCGGHKHHLLSNIVFALIDLV